MKLTVDVEGGGGLHDAVGGDGAVPHRAPVGRVVVLGLVGYLWLSISLSVGHLVSFLVIRVVKRSVRWLVGWLAGWLVG